MPAALAPAVQGRGIGKLVYSWLLESMIDAGVQLHRDGTANPALPHLARRMKRPMRGWQLEPQP